MREFRASRINTERSCIIPNSNEATHKSTYFTFFKRVLSNEILDLKDKTLQYNSFPTCVDWNTKLIKIHYIFMMMGVSIIFVKNAENKVIGKIKKTDLVSLRFKKPA